MRKRFDPQLELGQPSIETICLPHKSRDELPPILAGLQWIFTHPVANEEVFALLEQKVVGNKKNTGRPGMDLWQILVLGVTRLGLDCNYDRIEHIANYDTLVRQMMGLGGMEQSIQFHHRTISENICLIDEDFLAHLNEIVVRHGHVLLKKNEEEKLRIKTDSFVVETNVHYPTDLNLLWDASRKCIELSSDLADEVGLSGWRKAKNWKRKAKQAFRKSQKANVGGGANKEKRVKAAVKSYLTISEELSQKVSLTLNELSRISLTTTQGLQVICIKSFHQHLIKHIDLVERRMLKGETIPHEEKVFSLFEEHTEMIKKGKLSPPIEFGHRLMVSTDQYGLIVDYKVMYGGHESSEILPLIDRLETQFGKGLIHSLSTDKGFSSALNREGLAGIVEYGVLPKSGRLSQNDLDRESDPEWCKLRNQHSAVESDINSLEHHGLNRCPDKKFRGFTRYCGLGVLSLNLHRIGNKLLADTEKADRRKKRRRKVA
jgi:hypothetical protein